MPEIVTEVLPASGDTADVAGPEGRAWLVERYRRPEEAYVRLNMITSLTGSAAGADGTSETLTNRVDRRILGVIRADADVVLVGAQSVRSEGYVVPRSARLAIVTASGDLQGHRLTLEAGASPDRVLLVCPRDRARELSRRALPAGVAVVGVPAVAGRMRPEHVVAALAARGLRRIVCEGGPSLAAQFADAGLVDEFCVTVAPTLDPAERPFLPVVGRIPTEPVGMLVDRAGFSYLRLRAR